MVNLDMAGEPNVKRSRAKIYQFNGGDLPTDFTSRTDSKRAINPFNGLLSGEVWEHAHKVSSRYVGTFDYSVYDRRTPGGLSHARRGSPKKPNDIQVR